MANSRDRFFEELAVAPTRREAADLFLANEGLFAGLGPRDRARLFDVIADVIRNKRGEI